MSTEVLLSTAAAVVSLYAAVFHGGVFALHRRARDHAWAALTGAGACLVSLGTALLFVATNDAEASSAWRIQAMGAPAVTLGALGFAVTRLGISAPRLMRSGATVMGTLFVLIALAPELMVDRFLTRAESGGWNQVEISALGGLSLGLLIPYFFAPSWLSLRAWQRGQAGAGPLAICFCVWTLAGISDTLVGIGVSVLPYLNPTVGYMALAVAFSAILLRDFVRAMDASEQLGADLQEQALVRADALRAIDLRLARGEPLAAIGTLAAGVAHEINNPLAYVSTNLNQLRDLWEDASDSDEVKEILAECREGLGRVGTIVSDLLRMARHGARESEVCDLGEVVRSVLPLVLREAGTAIEIVTDLASPLPVFGNARLLGQVALNLALNAIHALPGPPNRPPRLELTARAVRGSAELVVRDTGPGIPAGVVGQIFEPSFTTKADGGGTGLGLALTRLVVTRHQGAIEVESGAEGTTVTVRLPLAAAR
jgi:signal transduction histidine kinase